MTAIMPDRHIKYNAGAAVIALRRIEQTTPPKQLLTAESSRHSILKEHRLIEHYLSILRVSHEVSTNHLCDYLKADPDPTFCIRPVVNTPGQLALLARADLPPDEFTRLGSIVLHYELDLDDTWALLRLYNRLRIGTLLNRIVAKGFERVSTISPTSPIVIAAHRYSINESCIPEFQRLLEVMALHNMSILNSQA